MGKIYISGFFLLLTVSFSALSQPGSNINLNKPKEYGNRTLGSEKTADTKFGKPKHLLQNTFTHYNYYFNANNILKEIVDNAKQSFHDNYTELLPFNNYSLDVTAANSDLDSVIYKCNAGIVLHDLRNDWVDNLYLILGETYFYRKNFDSASQVFRYINYAFAPKEEGGYDIPIGSNISNTDGVFSIATKEKNSLTQKVFSTPPSRNDALLWEAKNYVETGQYAKAAGILEILRNDPVFPERLSPELNKTLAWWFYKQRVYDSAANHLSKALETAENKLERARMEFLIGQMYQMSGNGEVAIDWYGKSASHTTDPIMEVYANLNSIKISGDTSKNILEDKLRNLLKMSKRDKYVSYRDIIYYAIAEVELERNDPVAAQKMLNKSIHYNLNDNPEQRSKSFLMLADINYDLKQYEPAKNFYDSIEVPAINSDSDRQRVDLRSPALTTIVENLDIIHDQDSLQTIAALPKDQRDDAIRKMAKYLSKQAETKEENVEFAVNPAIPQSGPSDIFNQGRPGQSSNWYFNNLALKSSGFNQFRQKWGNRANKDNWQRLAALSELKAVQANPGTDTDSAQVNNGTVSSGDEETDVDYETLSANLPLTEEKLAASNEKIASALFSNAEVFQNKLENYEEAISIYNELLQKYPEAKNKEQALFNLYYCYFKSGRQHLADSVRNALAQNFPKGDWTAKLTEVENHPSTNNDPATVEYKKIYDLFLEGKFEQAKNEKAKADSIYSNSYWTPQLLYIESIYYISTREDSAAIQRLENLNKLYPESPLAEKATTMIDVMRRRSQIENYLTNLQVTRHEDDASKVIDLTQVNTTINKVQVTNDSIKSNPAAQTVNNKVDTTNNVSVAAMKGFAFNPNEPQYVAILLDKVDPVFINEARNAFNRYNQSNYYNQKINITPVTLDERYHLVLMGPFTDAAIAMVYVDKTKPITGSRILPWLTADKYAYTIISESNLDVLKDSKDVNAYKLLIEKVLPGKFDK